MTTTTNQASTLRAGKTPTSPAYRRTSSPKRASSTFPSTSRATSGGLTTLTAASRFAKGRRRAWGGGARALSGTSRRRSLGGYSLGAGTIRPRRGHGVREVLGKDGSLLKALWWGVESMWGELYSIERNSCRYTHRFKEMCCGRESYPCGNLDTCAIRCTVRGSSWKTG